MVARLGIGWRKGPDNPYAGRYEMGKCLFLGQMGREHQLITRSAVETDGVLRGS